LEAKSNRQHLITHTHTHIASDQNIYEIYIDTAELKDVTKWDHQNKHWQGQGHTSSVSRSLG